MGNIKYKVWLLGVLLDVVLVVRHSFGQSSHIQSQSPPTDLVLQVINEIRLVDRQISRLDASELDPGAEQENLIKP